MKNLKYLNKYLLRYKWRFLLGTLFVGLSQYFSIQIPPAVGDALDFIINKTQNVDQLGQSGNFDTIFGADVRHFVFMVIGFSILGGLFMYLQRKTMIVMSRLIEYDLRRDIYAHYQTLDLGFYRRNKTGDLMARVSSDVSKVRMYLGPALMYGVRVTFLFSMIIYAMFQVSTTLSLYSLLPLPFLSISIYYVSSLINKKSAVIQKQISKLNSSAQEVYSGIRIVKSYVKEKEFQDFFDDQSAAYKTKALDLARVQALFFPLMILLVSISTLLTIYIGGKLVIAGELEPGNVVEFMIYINMLTWPITSIGWIASLVQEAEASMERINEMMLTAPAVDNQNKNMPTLEGRIEFINVSFTYPDTGIEALKNVSFRIDPGEKLVIVGKTAAGKTTIADLLLRYYDVTSGQILLDGIDIKDHNLFNLKKKIGYVSQNVFLFSDTVEENIRFGVPVDEHPDVEHYAEMAAINKDIKAFSEGYETKIGERGVTLSGGQKQRISIARALIKQPDIVILDDCLSAVDANTEHKILGQLDLSLKDKTAIIITHRISNLLKFDKVLVMDNGAIIAQGTHEELMQKDGYYRDLVEYQYQND